MSSLIIAIISFILSFLGPKKVGSESMLLVSGDMWKVFRGTMVVIASAALTAASEQLKVIDIGPYTPFIVPAVSAVLETLRRFLANTTTSTKTM